MRENKFAMSVMDYNNYGAYNAYQPYSSYSSYSSQPNHFNLKVGLLYDFHRCCYDPWSVLFNVGISSLCLMNFAEIIPRNCWISCEEERARLIRSLAGIIKSLVSSEVDIWVSVPPPHLPSPQSLHQDEYRQKFTNLTKFGSKRENFGLVPSTSGKTNRAERGRGRGTFKTSLCRVSFMNFS